MNSSNRNILEYRRRGDTLWNQFQSYRNHYIDISELFYTRKSRFLVEDDTAEQIDIGRRADQKIANSSTLMAVDVATAGFTNGLTPHSRKFINCVIADPDLMKYRPIMEYLNYLSETVLMAWNMTNYFEMKTAFWKSGLVFGIANSMQIEATETAVYFDPYEIGEYQLARGTDGEITTSYRRYSQSAGNLVKRFGFENCSEAVQTAFSIQNMDKRFLVHHIVQPNDYFNPYAKDVEAKKYESVYFEADQQDENCFLEIKGYRTKPISPFCWSPDGNQPYGDSRGMTGLGDAMQLQAQEKLNYEGVVLSQKPPWQIPANDGLTLDLSAGAENYYNPAEGKNKIEPLINFRPDHQGMIQEIQRTESRIYTIMYNNLFLSLSGQQDDPRKTATEIVEKKREQLLLLGSAIDGGQRSIKADVSRTIDILMYRGMLKPPPPELRGKLLDVKCVGVLALASQMVQVEGIQRYSGYVAQMAQIYPSMRHMLKPEKAAEEFAKAEGLPPSLLPSEQEYQNLVLQDQLAQKNAQELQTAQSMAQTAKDASQAKVGQNGGNMLDVMMQGAAQQQESH